MKELLSDKLRDKCPGYTTQQLLSTYKGKKVFIFGITGRSGTWLGLLLNRLGADVYGIGLRPNIDNSLFVESELHIDSSFNYLDIRQVDNYQLGRAFFDMITSDFIFNLFDNNNSMLSSLSTNTLGTTTVLEMLNTDEIKQDIAVLNVDYTDTENRSDRYPINSINKIVVDYFRNEFKNKNYNNIFLSTCHSPSTIGGGMIDRGMYYVNSYIEKCSYGTAKLERMLKVMPYSERTTIAYTPNVAVNWLLVNAIQYITRKGEDVSILNTDSVNCTHGELLYLLSSAVNNDPVSSIDKDVCMKPNEKRITTIEELNRLGMIVCDSMRYIDTINAKKSVAVWCEEEANRVLRETRQCNILLN